MKAGGGPGWLVEMDDEVKAERTLGVKSDIWDPQDRAHFLTTDLGRAVSLGACSAGSGSPSSTNELDRSKSKNRSG